MGITARMLAHKATAAVSITDVGSFVVDSAAAVAKDADHRLRQWRNGS